MHQFRILFSALLFVALAVPAYAEDAPVKPKKPKLEYLYLSVTGAKTDAVAAAAQKHVAALRGVRSFEWTAPRTEVKVVRVVGQATTPTLVAAFQRAGVGAAVLPVSQASMAFQKKLHCNSCVNKVKRALKVVKGTKDVQVAKDKLSVTVIYDAKKVTTAQIRKALASGGYPTK